MNHIKEYFKKNWPYFCAFFLPFFIMFFVYLMYGIYWNSETSPLLGDGFHQYVIFDTNLRNILHGIDSIFYTFSSGLGQNFYALSSYYLGSFLSPLVYFFDFEINARCRLSIYLNQVWINWRQLLFPGLVLYRQWSFFTRDAQCLE